MPLLLLPGGFGSIVSNDFPTLPIPYMIRDEPIRDDAIVGQFDNGPKVVRSRWPRHKKQFIIVYRALQSNDPLVQAIASHATIKDFIITKRFRRDTFNFTHPYYPNSIYVVRYNSDELPQTRLARTSADNGTDIWETIVPLIEVF